MLTDLWQDDNIAHWISYPCYGTRVWNADRLLPFFLALSEL
jgi:hypothetical protein